MGRCRSWAEERSAPVVATVAMLVRVMAYSLLGHSVLHGGPGQAALAERPLEPGRQLVGPGARSLLAHLRARRCADLAPRLRGRAGTRLLVGQALGPVPASAGSRASRSACGSSWAPRHSSLASTALFAVDAVARHWRFSEGTRMALALVGALAVANVAAGWGHPEDCVAVALVVWAALAARAAGHAGGPRAALLLGVGIAFQPLALLGVAPVLARLGWRGAARLWWRLVLPSLRRRSSRRWWPSHTARSSCWCTSPSNPATSPSRPSPTWRRSSARASTGAGRPA